MRRKDRAMSEEWAWELLKRSSFGVLSLVDNGVPYAVPLSYAAEGQSIYFHSAKEGRKIELIGSSCPATFSVVGRTKPVYANSFSTYFESAIAVGELSLVTQEEEKKRLLFLLCAKYLPGHIDKAESAIMHSLARTAVLALNITHITGKAKLPPKEEDWKNIDPQAAFQKGPIL